MYWIRRLSVSLIWSHCSIHWSLPTADGCRSACSSHNNTKSLWCRLHVWLTSHARDPVAMVTVILRINCGHWTAAVRLTQYCASHRQVRLSRSFSGEVVVSSLTGHCLVSNSAYLVHHTASAAGITWDTDQPAPHAISRNCGHYCCEIALYIVSRRLIVPDCQE